jgi:HK97 family phage portal protein
VEEICRIFRVPPHMVQNLERATFNNIEQMSLDFVMYSLMPYLKRWEQSMSRALLSREEKKTLEIRFNVDGLLRGDYKSRMEGYSVGINNGFLCPNDVRELEGFDRIPAELGGDTFLVQGAMIPLHMAGAAYQKPQEDAQPMA